VQRSPVKLVSWAPGAPPGVMGSRAPDAPG
jgi:hypothetical protein